MIPHGVRALGIMSGTSLDGIDVARCVLTPRGEGYDVRIERARTTPFAPELAARIRAALPPHAPAPRETALLDRDLGIAFGEAARAVSGGEPIDLVGCHGLTLYHDGVAGVSVQIGDPYVVRELTDATVVYDFRRADCARGGTGAPLVPLVDALLFRSDRETVALNLGGIANLTIVPALGEDAPVRGWDAGPGNMLLDAFVRARTGGAEVRDTDGAFAHAGRADPDALAALLADPYLALAPPKSTGRERYGDPFLADRGARLAELSLVDGCATLSAFTAEAVARDMRRYAPGARRLIASGGGARNATLLALLRERLPFCDVLLSDAFGIDADFKEALAFAILACETLRERPGALPAVTGAASAAVLGAIVPRRLAAVCTRLAGGATRAPIARR